VKETARDTFYDYFRNAQLYARVKPVTGALKNISRIIELGCDIFYCTAVVSGGEGMKYNWLVNNGFINDKDNPKKYYVEISEKYILDGVNSVLIDDGFHNLQYFNGARILFKRPWNTRQYNETDIPMSYTDDWNEIYKIIQKYHKERMP
jgi:5'(3')-deoxyribonucleotidase